MTFILICISFLVFNAGYTGIIDIFQEKRRQAIEKMQKDREEKEKDRERIKKEEEDKKKIEPKRNHPYDFFSPRTKPSE